MAEKKKMSIEDILAAARGEKSGDKPVGAPPPPKAAESESATEAASAVQPEAVQPEEPPAKPVKPAAAKPVAAAKSATGGKPGAMSVADILAAARAKGGGAAAEPKAAAAKPAAPAAEKAAAPKKPAAAKPAPAKEAAATTEAKGPALQDTASILAAARAAAKPGPISKAELAAREKGAAGKDLAGDKGKKKGQVPPMPEKPEYVRAQPAIATQGAPSRRGFLNSIVAGTVAAFAGSSLALGFSSLAVTMNLWTLGFARFMFPNILIEPPTKFKVGFPGEFAPGQVQTKFVPQFGVWIVRYEYDGQPQIYALQTVCTHLGCTPNWLEGEQKFKCPCHGSGFYKDGINFEGPAPRPLERFAIRLADDGQLEVDKSHKFKEEVGQWRDPASFVSV